MRGADFGCECESFVAATMDKTLGAPSVVTKENLGELFHQMLHPHLEEERQRGDEAVREEQERGKRRVEKVKGELEEAHAAKDATAQQLRKRQAEDREAVKVLCSDVARILKKRMRNRRVLGGVATLAFCSPPLFGPSAWQSYLSFLAALPLGYWTITGNKLIGTATSEHDAAELLAKVAAERGLSSMVSRFSTIWQGSSFQVSMRSTTNKLL